MGTLVRQLLAFDKDILGVTPTPPPPAPPSPTPPPARLLDPYPAAAVAGASTALHATHLRVHKKEDSLFWSVGEPIFDKVRDFLAQSADMAREDLLSREIEAKEKGPIQKMDEYLDSLVNQPRKKYKTQTSTPISSNKVLSSLPVVGALSTFQ